jgi:hypothetical protein
MLGYFCRTQIHLGVPVFLFKFTLLTKHLNYLHMANHILMSFDI